MEHEPDHEPKWGSVWSLGACSPMARPMALGMADGATATGPYTPASADETVGPPLEPIGPRQRYGPWTCSLEPSALAGGMRHRR